MISKKKNAIILMYPPSGILCNIMKIAFFVGTSMSTKICGCIVLYCIDIEKNGCGMKNAKKLLLYTLFSQNIPR